MTTEILDRLPPQDLDAERAVLGSMLLSGDACDEAALKLRPMDFYAPQNSLVFAESMALHEAGRLDAVMLLSRLKDAGKISEAGGEPYLRTLFEIVPTAANVGFYADKVASKSLLRDVIRASTDSIRDAYDGRDDPSQVASAAERRIFEVVSNRMRSDARHGRDVLVDALAALDERCERKSPPGVRTGFYEFDGLTGGLAAGQLIVLAARPSMGKSALASNIAMGVTKATKNAVLIVSLEMCKSEYADRMLSAEASVSAYAMREGRLNKEQRDRIISASTRISAREFYLDDAPQRTVTEMLAMARRIQRKSGLALVVIDYLQLINPENPRDPREQQVALISRRLKGMSKELAAPVLCLAQLNRESDKTGSEPKLSHLRESGAIEQDADIVMFIHRDDYYETNEEQKLAKAGKARLIVAKQRNGPTGVVPLQWQADHLRFVNVEREFT